MTDEERKSVARSAEKAINEKNLGLLDGHPGYVQARQAFALLFAAFPDLSSTIEQQIVAEEWVTTRVTLCGTHLGELMGLAPTGKRLESMNISLDRVVDGKVLEHFSVSDVLPVLFASGIMTPPAVFGGPPPR